LRPVGLESTRSREILPPIPAFGPLERIAPIYAVATSIVAGDALGNFHIAIPLSLALALSVLALGAFLAARRTLGSAAAYVALALTATVAVANVLDPPRGSHGMATMVDGSRVTVEGHLFREAEREAYGDRLYVRVERAAEQGGAMLPSSGNVRIAVLGGGSFKLGDEIRLSARIHFPRNYGNPGEFDYVGLMARDGIDATMTAPKGSLGSARFQIIGHRSRFPSSQIASIRTHIGEFFDRNLAYPENAEMRALVIGDQGEIGEPLRQTFARTGMAHLLVISGLHLSIVAAAMFAAARLAMMLFPGLANRGYGNKVAAVAAMLAVCAYASIAGHHVSTMRALVMVLAYMLAVAIDRSREAIASLALAAIVICVALPGSTADIGFQLSFASVIAIVLGMRRFAAWFARRKRIGMLPGEPSSPRWRFLETPADYLAVSFWAMVGTAPLTARHFNQFAVVGVAANAVVVANHGVRRDDQRSGCSRAEFHFGAGRAPDTAIRRERACGRQPAGGLVRRFAVGVVPYLHADDSRTRDRLRAADDLAARAACRGNNREASARRWNSRERSERPCSQARIRMACAMRHCAGNCPDG
jgi:competence protein ComEC